jgi:hypothetical protein
MRLLLLIAALAACQRHGGGTAKLPAVGRALRAAIGDVDGDGRGDIALADEKRLWVIDRAGRELGSVPAPGGIQALVVTAVDGRGAVVAGWGRDRTHQDAGTRIGSYRLEGGTLVEEIIAQPDSERPQVAAIVAAPPDLLIAWYADRYVVKSALARRANGRWQLEELAALRTASSYALGDVDADGRRDLVVGRFYGDQLASDGDAFLLRPDGTRVAIPTTRGVNAIALAGGDVFLADGWDKDYGKVARALLTRARWVGGAFHSEVIGRLTPDYTIWQLVAADLDADGDAELVARGNASVWLFEHKGTRWGARKIAREASDVVTGEIDGTPGDEVLVVGAQRSTWLGAK